jgi:peptide deformylase
MLSRLSHFTGDSCMSPIQIIPPTSTSLNAVAAEINPAEIVSAPIQELIDEMLLLARGERADVEKKVMVGLAAPQVGIALRVILVDMGIGSDRLHLGQLEAFINPEIIWHSDEVTFEREGCFSTGQIYGIVPRYEAICVRAYDREGNQTDREYTGFRARIFQHEIDHLNGIRFPDRVGCDGVLHFVEEEERPLYRSEWQNWPKRCPFAVWETMKSGQ